MSGLTLHLQLILTIAEVMSACSDIEYKELSGH